VIPIAGSTDRRNRHGGGGHWHGRQGTRPDFVAAAADQFGISDRIEHFDAPVQIAGHQVGAADIDVFAATGAEVIDAAVLEEAAYNAGDLCVVADAWNSGTQTADAAHQQVDPNAGLRGFIE
jgi:hypothetical protein